MRVLAFDTAANQCAVALWADGETMSHVAEPMERGHAEALVPMIEAALRNAGMGYGDLDRIAVTVGPGTFTGLRIGLATARGLGLAAGIPVAGIGSFDALAAAAAAPASGHLAVAIETKRADLYVQPFRGGRAVMAPAAVLPEELDEHLPPGQVTIIGDGSARAAEALLASARAVDVPGAPQFADPAVVAKLGAAAELPSGTPPPSPLYLRDPSVGRPKPAVGTGK